jgi:hypothetical protein
MKSAHARRSLADLVKLETKRASSGVPWADGACYSPSSSGST